MRTVRLRDLSSGCWRGRESRSPWGPVIGVLRGAGMRAIRLGDPSSAGTECDVNNTLILPSILAGFSGDQKDLSQISLEMTKWREVYGHP